jgi:L,D-transpeptidase ErfK/SrfK
MGRGGRACGAVLLGIIAAACGGVRPAPLPPSHPPKYDEALFAKKPLASYVIPTPRPGKPAETVIGEVRTVTARDTDTLLDLARLYDLGFEQVQAANPGMDPWVPPVGSRIVLPTAFVLPCCKYDGLVVNIPEMRLYYYRPGRRPGTTLVQTFPLGLGRGEYRTPIGVFHVKGKTKNPDWGVPERIRLEHLRERGDGRKFIKGGDPDNPLGKYRFELDRTLYRIHATNFPWGIGRLVSHGCAQLYPEDMAHLFPLVPVGTRVEFLYQPVKLGQRDGATWVEAHPDIYRRAGSPSTQAKAALRAQGVSVDAAHIHAAVAAADGVPRVVERRRWWHWVL